MFKRILLLSLCFCLSAVSAGNLPAEIDFARGNQNKWRVYGFTKASFVRGKGFAGETKSSGRLVSLHVNIPAGQADVVEIVLQGKWKSSKLYFHGQGGKFTESAMVRGTNEENLTIFEPGRNSRWKGTVTALRLDVNGTSQIKIRSIRFRKSDGRISLKSPWLAPTALNGGRSAVVVREPRFPQPVFFKGMASADMEISCEQFDIFGKKLGSETIKASAGKFSGKFRFIANSALLKIFVRNKADKRSSFTLELFQTEKKPVKTVRENWRAELLNVPQKTDENSRWSPQVRFTGKVPVGKRFRLRLAGPGALNIIIGDILISKKSAVYTLPPVSFRYITPGKYRVTAEASGMPCQIGKKELQHVRKSAVVPARAVIDRSGNRPCYVINGKEKAETMEYLFSDPPPSAEAIQQGINAYNSGVKGIRLRLIFRFTPEGKLTFDEIDSAMQSVLSRLPDANLMLHVSVTDPGPSFRQRYPEEGIKDDKGNFMIKNYRDKPEATSSMASRRWLRDSQTLLEKLVAHLNKTPQGERVIGILPCSGITWEWLNWGSARGVMVDYSEHCRQYFIACLKEVYGNDISKLNQKWKSSYESFSQVQIPVPARRRSADTAEFRTPASYQPEIDYADCISRLIAENVEALCRTVKKASGNRLLAGSYYGYTIYLSGVFRAQNAGHQALGRLLRSPYVDILSAPSRYAGRELGGGSGFMFPEGSVNLHKKLIISECDDRPINASSATGRSATVAASRSAFERACAMQFAASGVMRWFDFSKGWVMDEPRMLDVVSGLSRFDKMMLKLDPPAMPAEATAAVITAERSAAAMNPNSHVLSLLLENGYRELVGSGISFSMFNADDLEAAVKNRKLVLLLNLFRLDRKEEKAVEKLFAEKGRIIYVCSGLSVFGSSGKLDDAFISKLFNSRFNHSAERKEQSCRTTAQAEKWLGIPAGRILAPVKPCGDIRYPAGTDWVSLAEDKEGNIALGLKELNGNLVLWSAYPILPADVLRALAKRAGMPQIHAPNASCWFNNGYGFVHSASETLAEITLPAGFRGICEFPDMKRRQAVNGKVSKRLAPGTAWLFSLFR